MTATNREPVATIRRALPEDRATMPWRAMKRIGDCVKVTGPANAEDRDAVAAKIRTAAYMWSRSNDPNAKFEIETTGRSIFVKKAA